MDELFIQAAKESEVSYIHRNELTTAMKNKVDS